MQLIAEGQSDPVFLTILEYAYDPYLHYYVKKISVPMVEGTETFETQFGLLTNLLDALSERRLSGNRAMSVVLQTLRNLRGPDQEIFVNILKKDLRCGISVKTINKAIPDQIRDFGIMKAYLFETSRFRPGMYMSIKYEGNRGVKNADGLFSRNGIPITGVGHVLDALNEVGLGSADGELRDFDKLWQRSSGDIRRDAESPGQVYHIFDIPEHPGTFTERYRELEKVRAALAKMRPLPLIVVKHKQVYDLVKVNAAFQRSLDRGHEGLVIKTPNHRYQTRRSYDWLKLKNTREEDLPIVDVFEGTGRLEGSLGGIIVQRSNGVTVRVGSGFSDGLRARIWADPDAYIGKTAEVLYHEKTPDGSLRHPRLGKGGVRFDK